MMRTYKEFILESKESIRQKKREVRQRKKQENAEKKGSAGLEHLRKGPIGIYTRGVPASRKSGFRRFLTKKHGFVASELDVERARGLQSEPPETRTPLPPTFYSRELAAQANSNIEGAKEKGHSAIISDTLTPGRAAKSAKNALKNIAGFDNPVGVFPGHGTLEKNIKRGERGNRKRPENAPPGSGRVPKHVMSAMARNLRQMSRKEQRRHVQARTILHKRFRTTRPNLEREGIGKVRRRRKNWKR